MAWSSTPAWEIKGVCVCVCPVDQMWALLSLIELYLDKAVILREREKERERAVGYLSL